MSTRNPRVARKKDLVYIKFLNTYVETLTENTCSRESMENHYLNIWPIMTVGQNLEHTNQDSNIVKELIFKKKENIIKVEEMNPNSE